MSHSNDRPITHRSASPAGAGALRDVSAFSDAAARSYNAIYLTALAIVRDPETAADITQETFLRAWLKIDTLRDATLLEPWLARIARNTAAQWLRTGQHRSRVLPLISMEEIPVEPADNINPTPRQAAGQAEQNAQLTQAVMALPDDLRQAVLLHYAEGMSPSDIARLNGEAPSTVTRRLEKARTLLRQHLESGFAASLAASTRALRPGAADLQRTLGLLTAAAAIPAATRAQLLQAIADTPPPPMIEAVTSAAQAATLQEAGIMKTIIAKIGAAKLIAGAAAIAAVGGGVYGVSSLLREAGTSKTAANVTANIAMSGSDNAVSSRLRNDSNVRNVANQRFQPSRSMAAAQTTSRLSPAERIALLKNDLISTNPLFTVEPGETTGTIHFDLQVVNESGNPVANAEVHVTEYGFETGLYFSTVTLAPSEVTTASTNATGIARLSVAAGPSTSEPLTSQLFRTSRITATATHPDYTPTRQEMDFTSVTKLVLTSGNILEVLPVDATTSAPIRGEIKVEFNSAFQPEQYTRADGTVVFRKIPDDNAEFILKYLDEQETLYVSNVQRIALPSSSATPTVVPLHHTLTVNGRLDNSIPRPVTDVEVHTKYWIGPDMRGKTTSTVAVAPDGTFTLNNIPKGTEISVAALGNGYCAVTSRDNGAYPFLVTATRDKQLLTLPMKKTSNATLKVLDPSGNPVSGADVSANVSLWDMGDNPRWGGPYTAVTDEFGVARIENIPSLKNVSFNLKHPQWRFPSREARRTTYYDGSVSVTHSYDIELDLSGGGDFNQTVKAEAKPPEPPSSAEIMFLLPEGATMTYTTPPAEKNK